jgi:outer membrane protein with beta-barrel domain
MRYVPRGLALATVLLLLGTSALSAQKPQTRKGFWIGFGFGYGSYGISCDGCPSDNESSYTGYLKMGGTLNPHLLLGGETVGWSKSEGGATITAGNVSFNAYYYPKPAGGLFLNGGVGFSRVELSGGGNSDGDTGAGFSLGAGYDIRVGTNLSIVPNAQWVYGHPTDGLSQSFLHFALGVTFH